MPDDKLNPSADLDLGEAVRGLAGGQYAFNRYSLVKLIGRGRASAVWQAWDDKENRDVALKFLPGTLKKDAAALDEIKRTVAKLKDLKAPQLAKVFSYEEEDKLVAIAMELVDGSSLSAMRAQKKNQIFEAAELKEWLRQLCAILETAHAEAKLVHGALKPTNLLVDAKGALWVTDFGLGRKVGDWANRLEGAKDVSHNLRYSSPQQAMGQESTVTDDVYGLGITLHELITGKPPFMVGNILAQIMEDTPLPMTRRRRDMRLVGEPIPRAWDETVAACLAKEADKRPPSMARVAEMLELTAARPEAAAAVAAGAKPPAAAKAGQPTIRPAIAAPAAAPPVPPSAFRKNLVPIVALAASIVLAFALWYFMGAGPSTAPPTPVATVVPKTTDADALALENERLQAIAKQRVAEAEAKRLMEEVEKRRRDEEALKAAAKKAQDEAEAKRLVAEAERKRLEDEIAKSREMEAKRKEAEDAIRKAAAAAAQAAAEQARKDAEAQRLAAEEKMKQLAAELEAQKKREAELQALADKTRKEADQKNASATAEARRLAIEQEARKLAEAKLAEQKERERQRKLEEAARMEELERRRAALMAKTTATSPVDEAKKAAEERARREAEAKLLAATQVQLEKPVSGRPWVNSLGLRFVPAGDSFFCTTECRVQDFETFATATRYNAGPAWKNPGFKQGPTHPVINVNWDDAQAFCKWLTEKERKEGLIGADQAYRLPTDQEWSQMAGLDRESGATPLERSGQVKGVYPWGNAWPPPAGAGNYADSVSFDRFENTAPAASFAPNSKGVYDLGGNVWEWVQDWSDSSQKSRVLRGASWFGYVSGSMLSAHRMFLAPTERRFDNGFRVVLGK